MRRPILSLLILAFSFQTCTSQSFDKGKLDNYLNILESNNKLIGSVAILQNGQVIYKKSTGFADVETGKKPDEHTKYRVGSISKTFTTVLVFKTIEENKLQLTETLDKYFPTIKNASKITVSMLLNHRSGIHNFTDGPDYLSWNTKAKSQAELVGIIEKGGSDFEPDSKAQYSNSNFVLLTYILEKVNGKSFSDQLNEKIIKPLGLKDTYLGGKINLGNNEANSYEYGEKWVKQPETDMSVPLGAGAVVSTPVELTRFAEALFNGKLVSEKSLAQMKTIRDGYGMGLFQIPFYDKMSFGHTGGIDGFRSVFSYFPNEKVAFSWTTNGSSFDNNKLSIAMLSAVFDKPYDMPEIITYKPETADLEKYPGSYASKQIPLKVTISQSGTTITAQATGQPAFPLEATGKDKFKFDQAGVVMEFNPAEKQMTLKQGGAVYQFVKE